MLCDRLTYVTVLVAAALGVGCGGAQQPAAEAAPPEPAPTAPAEAEPAPPEEAAAPAAAPGEQIAWADMTEDQKKQHMKTVVLPAMKDLFKELDPEEFAEMTCATCHGEEAKEGKFEMPNEKLPKLEPTDNFAKHMKSEPEATKFMMERVTPEMAKLLDVPLYNAETQQGFGCFNCHTMAKK